MATDFIHSTDIIDGIISIINANCPNGWLYDDGTDVPLRVIQHGDMSDFTAEEISSITPAILIKSIGIDLAPKQGISGVTFTQEHMRVIMVRKFSDCIDDNGNRFTNFAKSRYYYMKQLNEILFSDTHRKLATITNGTRTEVSLASNDTNGAEIVNCIFRSVDYDGSTPEVSSIKNLSNSMWAIAVDFDVIVRSG